MERLLVAFSGKAGCGKSTIAKGIVEKFTGHRFAIADKLKEHVKYLFPELVQGKHKNVYRWVYQKYGDATRAIKTDVWIDIVLRDIEFQNWQLVVIDDLRFKNEFFKLRKKGFILVRVERDPKLLRKWGYDPTDPHLSETDLDDLAKAGAFDLRIQNNYEHPFEEAVEYVAKFLGLTEGYDIDAHEERSVVFYQRPIDTHEECEDFGTGKESKKCRKCPIYPECCRAYAKRLLNLE